MPIHTCEGWRTWRGTERRWPWKWENGGEMEEDGSAKCGEKRDEDEVERN